MKTLYISDMDGTLLQSNGKLSEYSKEKLNEFYPKVILCLHRKCLITQMQQQKSCWKEKVVQE